MCVSPANPSFCRPAHHHQPENILIDSQGYARLCDFGLAKVLRRGETTFTMCGSPEYMAPEMIIGRGHGIKTDVWSFGVLIWEMLIGKTPFAKKKNYHEEAPPAVILMTILKETIKYPKGTPKAATTLMKKIFNRDAHKRMSPTAIKKHYFFGELSRDKEVGHTRLAL